MHKALSYLKVFLSLAVVVKNTVEMHHLFSWCIAESNQHCGINLVIPCWKYGAYCIEFITYLHGGMHIMAIHCFGRGEKQLVYIAWYGTQRVCFSKTDSHKLRKNACELHLELESYECWISASTIIITFLLYYRWSYWALKMVPYLFRRTTA